MADLGAKLEEDHGRLEAAVVGFGTEKETEVAALAASVADLRRQVEADYARLEATLTGKLLWQSCKI